MKIVSRIMLVAVISFTACNKLEVKPELKTSDEVAELTKNFTENANKKITGKDVARAAVADIGMAAGVVQTTGWVFGIFGPMYAVGVTAISTMASYGALKTAPQPGTTVLVNNLTNANLGEVIPNPNNPYENIGTHHNLGLAQLAGYCGPSFNYTCNLLQLDSVLFSHYIAEFEGYTGGYNPDELSVRFSLYNQYLNMSSSEMLNEFMNSGAISQEAGSILQSYFSAIEASPSSTEFCAYSIQVENLVQNSTTLSQADKNSLLLSFAIGRYSVTYWSNIYL